LGVGDVDAEEHVQQQVVDARDDLALDRTCDLRAGSEPRADREISPPFE
jgi:hypothetical protein